MLIDTHAHLTWDDFKPDLQEVISRAKEAGITHVINIGADMESSKKAAKLE
ncbi:MAG: TatD family hydrolase, partial [Candidatus Daviesbacteria bacterium]|nr:TatD family hydrolase [Candidatus Daviesbacteria bacterium]